MNTRKLYVWYSEGSLDTELPKLSLKDLRLLKQSLEEELTRYEYSSRNYTPEKKEKYSVPYTNRIKEILSKLQTELNNK